MKLLKRDIFQKILTYKQKNRGVLCITFLLLTAMTAACGTGRAGLQETLNKGTFHSGVAKIGKEISENCIKSSNGKGGIADKEGSPEVSNKEGEMGESKETSVITNKSLAIEQIREMDAGTILDISQIEGKSTDLLFYSEELDAKVQERILGISYQENDNICMEELRYLRVLHMGIDGQTHIGELLVNQSIADEVLEIMRELYENDYVIEKMVLVDAYGADDELSMEDNNTSAFNYREIAGSSRMSRHSLGLAIDINPKYNPYVKHKSSGETVISPNNAAEYADRSGEFAYKIDEDDLCYRLFTEHGFTWGGSWNSVKDYQHFEK